ncbi:MAG: type I DNA topoisomerase [Anaerolineales bacterium]|nr:type I DNA topoisomerase [Anaerolineales bacterium]
MEAYCVKCKTKREIAEPQAVFTATGTPATKGRCPVCGANLFRMGATDAHAGLERPAPQPRAARKTAAKPTGKAGRKPADGGPRHGSLVIVESPAKAKTVGRFLGRGYTVRASVGHVRDLLRSTLSVDVEHDFEPKYRVPNEKREVVKTLKAEAAHAAHVYLATDPDREGEAIAWHLLEAAEIEPARAQRVVFHEITRPAIAEAFAHPRDISMDLVNAQQTRRILDRLVGYSLSPLLWAKVRGRLSAGRVQSVAVRLIADREREIEAFSPVEYWSVDADLAKAAPNGHGKPQPFRARLFKIGNDDVGTGQNCRLKTEADVQALLPDLQAAAYQVARVKSGERRRNPSAPFTTSTLQQEASRRLGFTAKRTMAAAQQLYEGIEVGDGQATGLITYMRTDSTNVSTQAQAEARAWVTARYGADYLPAEAPQYKTRSKGAQEAHEAIRPTQIDREPTALTDYLSRDQLRLYTLIWQRFVASQMAAAVFDTVSVEIQAAASAQTYLFRVAGSTLRFAGFLAIYEDAQDEDAPRDEEAAANQLPALSVDEALALLKLLPEQHFTQPPPRYTEASLVKSLEEYGIGRPSTYAPTISTIQQRGYVLKEDKRLVPTETGLIVNDLLVQHFPEIVDVNFTANMENELDQIADGEREWVGVLNEFWAPFVEQVKAAEADMPQVNTGPDYVGRDCPESGHPLVIRWGRYGKFIGCSDFPKCRYTEPWLEKIGVDCPKDHGALVERKTRKGRVFYGCANYPACDFTSWKRPLPQPCPNCGGLLVVANKNYAQCLVCEQQTALADLPPIQAPTEPGASLPVAEGLVED